VKHRLAIKAVSSGLSREPHSSIRSYTKLACGTVDQFTFHILFPSSDIYPDWEWRFRKLNRYQIEQGLMKTTLPIEELVAGHV
jgi:hypothetical protein